MLTVELKNSPALKRLVKGAFPDYRKRNVFVSPFAANGEHVNSYWDGGSRDEHVLIEINTLRTKPLPTSHPFYDLAGKGISNVEDEYVTIDSAGNVRLKTIPRGYALVTAGTFCGKPATAHIKAHPDDLPTLTGKTGDQITDAFWKRLEA